VKIQNAKEMNSVPRTSFEIHKLENIYRPWARQLLEAEWGGTIVVSRGRIHDASKLPGLIALDGSRPLGLATYRIDADSCELVSLNSLIHGVGIGSTLVSEVNDIARSAGCHRLWLITTNDNTPALRFYQKNGFRLVALHRDALVESRNLKPSIPFVVINVFQLWFVFEVYIYL
jgi:GNAT superfamily N-acetyltransferase